VANGSQTMDVLVAYQMPSQQAHWAQGRLRGERGAVAEPVSREIRRCLRGACWDWLASCGRQGPPQPRALPRRYWFQAATKRPTRVTGTNPRTMPQRRGSITENHHMARVGILSRPLPSWRPSFVL
jgi:hypothetical protein